MDKYLHKDAFYNRLLREYREHGTLIICVDYDDTIFDFEQKGDSFEMMHDLVRRMYAKGFYIIIWTANSNLDQIRNYLKETNIPYHSINEDAPMSVEYLGDKKPTRKIFCNAYVDDRAGIINVYNALNKLLKNI